MRVDVAVVGAGIGGAVLALALARRGWRIALIERERVAPRLARPEILWGATPKALDRLGLGDMVRQMSVLLDGVTIGPKDAPFLTIERDDFAAAGIEAFSTNPSRTRSAIVDAALATGKVDLQRGVEVKELLRDHERAIGVRSARDGEQFDVETSLVVGDDGTHSIVRTALGIGITLKMFPIDFISAAIRWPHELQPNRGRVFINPQKPIPGAGFVPWPDGEGVLLLPQLHGRADDILARSPEDFWSELIELAPPAAAARDQIIFPSGFARVRRPFGHAETYVADGAAIIGDAAHPMTPAGGQGANASIWDALALADVADAALRSGGATRERLMPYERLRRRANERSVRFSRIANRFFKIGPVLPVALIVPPLARLANRLGWPKQKLIGSFATAFVSEAEALPSSSAPG